MLKLDILMGKKERKMLNKNGKSTVLIVLITIIITMLFCYVLIKVNMYASILKNGGYYFFDKQYSVEDFEKLKEVKKIIDTMYLNEYDEEDLIDATISGMMSGLDDPYAAYYNKRDFETMYTQTQGEYVGIGIYVSYDTEKSMPIVITPMVGSPAADIGILPGDYIEYVDDLNATTTSYEELVDAIKGFPGTKVKVGLIRFTEDEKTERIEYEVERKKINVNPITEEVYEGNIGYIKLTSFDIASYDEFKNKYNDLIKNKKVEGLIVDLRNNPGGVLETSAQIVDLIVPEGKIVYTADKNGSGETLYSDKEHIEVPLVVIVNEGSASASEIFTAAVKDYGIGKIIGEKTYGKGVVQTMKSLGDGSYVKLTTAEYFSPKGNKINGLGVEPDIKVELPEDIENIYDIEFEKDTQLQTAINEIKNMMK